MSTNGGLLRLADGGKQSQITVARARRDRRATPAQPLPANPVHEVKSQSTFVFFRRALFERTRFFLAFFLSFLPGVLAATIS
jgi:hypothetical protein